MSDVYLRVAPCRSCASLAITNRNQNKEFNAFRSCFWRTNFLYPI